jgi:diguanylate cyclase (GGDEF)-like protein
MLRAHRAGMPGPQLVAGVAQDKADSLVLSARVRTKSYGVRATLAGTSWLPLTFLILAGGCAAGILLLLAGREAGAALVVAVSLAFAVGLAVGRTVEKRRAAAPLTSMATSLEMLAARDVLALVDEFANLAQGEKPRMIEVHATPIPLPSDPHLRRVAEALNGTIARLEVGARQFQAASEEPCRRLFYVGADDYLLGCSSAEAMGAELPDGGEVLLLMASFRHAGVELRRRGFENTLRERFPTIEVIGAIESRLDTAKTTEKVKAYIKTHPNLAGIYCSEGTGVLGAIGALTGTELAGHTVVICHDTCEGTVAGIKAGLISTAVTQDPFGQGHDTAIHLFNAVAHGWKPSEPRLTTASDLITHDNYEQFWRPYEGGEEPASVAARRPRPLGPSSRPIRIAMLGLEDDPFWPDVRKGVKAAADELASFNATVDWVVPEGSGAFDVSVRGPAVDALVEKGYDALAAVNYDSNLVPYLNRAVDKGVVVATFNAESSSLQGLVATLSKERKRLEIAAGDLEIAANHDALTGTLNRLAMNTDLEQAREEVAVSQQPAAVIMLDIDHFKAYNDEYGHAAGDDALKMVADRIQHEIRPGDRLYRYGGEEFLVLLKGTKLEAGAQVAARIACGVTTLGLPHAGNQPWGVITVSAGVAAMDPAAAMASDCISDADVALYRSKRSGRNTVATYQGEAKPFRGLG